jgi:tetratricopeptide (TPR) repeat protein
VTASLLERAKTALAMAREDPRPALKDARRVLEAAADDDALATAHFACGLAHRTLANGADSTYHLEQAARLAGQDQELVGQILRSLAFNYAQAGDHALSDRTIERSVELSSGQEADLSRLQQAFLLIMRGEHQTALPVLSAAVSGFGEPGSEDYLELTLYNRALIYMAFGDYDAAVADLRQAYEIGMGIGHQVSAADAALHLSQVLGWRDDVPGAMRWHSRSVELRTAAGAANPVADAEHAFVLIQARLMREAEEILRSAIPQLESAGDNEAVLVSSRLLLVDVLLDKGEYQEALHQVEMARAETPPDGRWRFDIAAAHHRVRATAGEISVDLLRSMMATADEMSRNGESHAAAVERFRAIATALQLGNTDIAGSLLPMVLNYTRTGPLWLQVKAWTAVAQLRLAMGDRRGAASAVRAGMNRLDGYRSGIGATDLRIHAAGYGDELARIGIELAIGSGSVEKLYAWSERLRSRPEATTPDGDLELETALADLRRVTAEMRRAGQEELRDARRRVSRFEERVRQIGRQRPGSATANPVAPLRELRARLADRTLVEFVETDTDLYAIVVTTDRARLVDLGTCSDVVSLVDHIRFSAERIARPSTSQPSRLAAIVSAREATTSLHQRLVTPLGVATNSAVVIPSGTLHSVPWGMVFDIPVVTAPSATTWLEAAQRTSTARQSLVVRGPDLAHAEAEANEIAELIGAVQTTSVDESVAELVHSSLVHFACHARPRTDSPLFSSLILEDGELTLYDIEHLPTVPATIVLAACSGAGSVLATGTEVLSLAGSFLHMGARTVIAPLFTVSDAATHAVMSSLHRSLAAGLDAASALRSAAESDDPGTRFTALSFVCVGAC